MSEQRGGEKEAGPEGGETDNLEIICGYGEKNNLIRAGKTEGTPNGQKICKHTREGNSKKKTEKLQLCRDESDTNQNQ